MKATHLRHPSAGELHELRTVARPGVADILAIAPWPVLRPRLRRWKWCPGSVLAAVSGDAVGAGEWADDPLSLPLLVHLEVLVREGWVICVDRGATNPHTPMDERRVCYRPTSSSRKPYVVCLRQLSRLFERGLASLPSNAPQSWYEELLLAAGDLTGFVAPPPPPEPAMPSRPCVILGHARPLAVRPVRRTSGGGEEELVELLGAAAVVSFDPAPPPRAPANLPRALVVPGDFPTVVEGRPLTVHRHEGVQQAYVRLYVSCPLAGVSHGSRRCKYRSVGPRIRGGRRPTLP